MKEQPPLFTAERLAGASLEEIASVLNSCYTSLLAEEESFEVRMFDRLSSRFNLNGNKARKRTRVQKRILSGKTCSCGKRKVPGAVCCRICWMAIMTSQAEDEGDGEAYQQGTQADAGEELRAAGRPLPN